MKTALKTKLRIGKIGYYNVLPFYHGLTSSDVACFEFYESYPTKVNLAMRQGKIDIAPISSLEYLNHQKEYSLLPGLTIGARDFSGSVMLLSKEKIEGLHNETIGVTNQSLSSVALLRILMKMKYRLNNRFEYTKLKPHEAVQKYRATLVIGDEALLFRSTDFLYKYDLSELWWNWTSKPFCFALWAVRKEFLQKNSNEVSLFWHRLKDNLHKNLSDIEALIREALQMSFLDTNFPKVFGYLFNLSYGLDGSMIEGLELFYRLAHRMKISPKLKALEFVKMEKD